MKAIGKYIVIDPIKENGSVTKGGLLLTEKHREDIRYKKAKVLIVGNDVKGLEKDNIIYYDKAAGFNIDIDNEQYKIIKEFDVVVVL